MRVNKIFISYTTDLQVYCDAVFNAINGLDDCKGIRQPFDPDKPPPIDVSIEKVIGCNILVGIVGFHYGSIPRGNKFSYIELEYEAAINNKVTPLMFVAPKEGIIWIPCEHLSKIHTNCRKLKAFKNLIRDNTCSQNWHEPVELAREVLKAIHNHFQNKKKRKKRFEPIASIETKDPFMNRDILSEDKPQIQKENEIIRTSNNIPQKEDNDE